MLDEPDIEQKRAIVLPDVAAFAFDGKGGVNKCDIESIESAKVAQSGFTWTEIRRDSPQAAELLENSKVDRFVIDALTAEETRPRCTLHGEGALLFLRGVNLNPGADWEDMVSVRLWIEEHRVIGVWVEPVLAIRDIFDAMEQNRAPVSVGDLLARIALRLAFRAEPTIAALNERIDDLEEMDIVDEAGEVRRDLADIRRTSIGLRRYMHPQRDALTTLEIEDLHWLSNRDRSRIREAADRVTRLGEELDSIRDRAQVLRDQIIDLRAETMNRRMLVLALVAALFLPLTLLTGLLGINVSGIPGASDRWAFAIVCGILIVIGALQLLVFRFLGLFR